MHTLPECQPDTNELVLIVWLITRRPLVEPACFDAKEIHVGELHIVHLAELNKVDLILELVHLNLGVDKTRDPRIRLHCAHACQLFYPLVVIPVLIELFKIVENFDLNSLSKVLCDQVFLPYAIIRWSFDLTVE